MSSTTDYNAEATEAAVDALNHFEDEILELLVDEGSANDDMREYSGGDSYHHETHVDRSYGVDEATKLLSDLSDHEETDSGLWEGQDWEQIVDTKAAFTFGNAVYSEFRDMIGEINDQYGEELEQWEENAAQVFEDYEDEDNEDVTELPAYVNEDGELTEDKKKEIAKEAFDSVVANHTPESPDMTRHQFTLCLDFTVQRVDGGEINYPDSDTIENAVRDMLRKLADGGFKANHEADSIQVDDYNVTAGSVYKSN